MHIDHWEDACGSLLLKGEHFNSIREARMARAMSERKRQYRSGDVFYGLTVGTYRQALINKLTAEAGHPNGAPTAEIINRYSVGPLDTVASPAPADQPSLPG